MRNSLLCKNIGEFAQDMSVKEEKEGGGVVENMVLYKSISAGRRDNFGAGFFPRENTEGAAFSQTSIFVCK